jgi:large subunit ribosomal protein L18
MNPQKEKTIKRVRRQRRIREKVMGGPERPRLSVFRSLRNIYAQVIDDINGVTLAAASTKSKAITGKIAYGGNKAAAEKIGELIARQALELGIRQVRFDRRGYKYHGRIKALADAARKAGLVF